MMIYLDCAMSKPESSIGLGISHGATGPLQGHGPLHNPRNRSKNAILSRRLTGIALEISEKAKKVNNRPVSLGCIHFHWVG